MAELIYSKKANNTVDYLFYDDMTYRISHAVGEEAGTRWKVEDGDVLVIQPDDEWYNVSKDNAGHMFIPIALWVYRHIQYDKEIDKILLDGEDEGK